MMMSVRAMKLTFPTASTKMKQASTRPMTHDESSNNTRQWRRWWCVEALNYSTNTVIIHCGNLYVLLCRGIVLIQQCECEYGWIKITSNYEKNLYLRHDEDEGLLLLLLLILAFTNRSFSGYVCTVRSLDIPSNALGIFLLHSFSTTKYSGSEQCSTTNTGGYKYK